MSNEHSAELVKRFTQWVDEEAKRRGVEAYLVLSKQAINDLADKQPTEFSELLDIKGIKQKKQMQYGHKLLQIIQEVTSKPSTGSGSKGGGGSTHLFPERSVAKSKGVDTKKTSLDDFLVDDEGEEKTDDLNKPLSVSEFLGQINAVLESQVAIVKGEITQVKKYDYYWYVSIKDEAEASMTCAIPKRIVDAMGVDLDDGMEIVVTGYPLVSAKYGAFSFRTESLQVLGAEGALKKAYEKLKKKLEAAGYFAPETKLPVPDFVHRIGVISSKSGVVIHDLMENLEPRGFQINFYDSRVEGPQAVRQVIDGIKFFNSPALRQGYGGHGKPIDVIVIIRGGGSLESLQAFNNENVAQAVFQSRIPIIAGIGHDVDVPIASLTADQEASTPTAVAHMLNQSWAPLTEQLPDLEDSIINIFESHLETLRTSLINWQDRLAERGNFMLGRLEQIVEDGWLRIRERLDRNFKIIADSLTSIEKYLLVVDPQNTLKRGYSYVTKKGQSVTDASTLKSGEEIETKFYKGEATSTVKTIKS